jgi:beta-glucosidase
MAASWDTAALLEWGVGMGKEFYAKGANVQLGPGLCLARVPQNGRLRRGPSVILPRLYGESI